ncbi:MAG: DNA repair protein RecN [Cyclobacteriaceae bacterium]|nr:DNA repair protein RecN [Cyclobacteriaceae bacterium]MCX7637362.1 DNA repair protein RecN [Cyclobacteriaceae bacterium]MDW8330062.1 DNA repair protein RecN [Cyclobacteriaceae bacterium]
MLRHLLIKNYALIRQLEFSPSAHLNAITGETGAGKSIMLGAIGLLTGNRADTKVLWDENEKCVTEGTFDIRAYGLQKFFEEENLDYADQTIIRREISPGGKSRAFINDTPVTLDVLKRLGNQLLDIHSQHETLELGNLKFQLKLVDAYSGHQNLIKKYAAAWEAFESARQHLRQTEAEVRALSQEADYIHFQLEELKRAALEEGEQEKWEAELKIMEHAEEIKSRLQSLLASLSQSDYAALNNLREARQLLQSISGYGREYENLLQRLISLLAELSDIAAEIERLDEQVEYDPKRVEQLTERLDLIYRLQQKHRVTTVGQLLHLQQELEKKSSTLANLDEALSEAQKRFAAATAQLSEAADKLSQSRKKSFEPLCKQLVVLLAELGMPEARLSVQHSVTEPGPLGIDRVELLFSANKGMPLRPLSQVASGGEFSRLMFAVKYVMAEKTEMPTLVLDEIDTGVSGETAVKLARLMQLMAKKHQLITITHLPQIAARADTHFVVFKESYQSRTVSAIRQLTAVERVDVIARMIAGERPTPAAVANAKELLQEAGL